MNIAFDIPWKRYALITELARRLDKVSPQFGKTALQKLVFLLQEVYEIDCGYDFELYSYGPFDSQLLNDLDIVECWGYVSVDRVNDTLGGYKICPTDTSESIREKATTFLDEASTQEAINDLVSTYGNMKARDLELRATTVYVANNLRIKKGYAPKEKICGLVGQIKPKFSAQEIEAAFEELRKKSHIQMAAA